MIISLTLIKVKTCEQINASPWILVNTGSDRRSYCIKSEAWSLKNTQEVVINNSWGATKKETAAENSVAQILH